MTDSARVGGHYHVQDGCWNCQSAVRIYDPDFQDDLYCQLGAPLRPRSGSHHMGERWGVHGCHQAGKVKWIEWSQGREVARFGICEHWNLLTGE